MGLLDALRDTIEATIDTASKIAGDRSSGWPSKWTKQLASKGCSRKK